MDFLTTIQPDFNLSGSVEEGEQLSGAVQRNGLVVTTIMFALGVFGNSVAIVFLLVYKYRRVEDSSPVMYSSNLPPSPRLSHGRDDTIMETVNPAERRRSSAYRTKIEISHSSKRRRKRNKFGPFHTLVLGLITVDLVGNLATSPLTLLLYSTKRTIHQIGGNALCYYSAYVMMYLGIVTMASLMTMAIDRVLSIQFPYFYHRRVTPNRAAYAFLAILLASAVFTALPTFGFGRIRSMYPHTWCFADWHAQYPKDKAFNFIYAIIGTLMILTTVICNITVVVGLYKMKRRLRGRSTRKKHYLGRESQMIIQLIVMTLIYLVCWLPLMIRILVNQITFQTDGEQDRIAIWLAAANPILDPWVYILLRRSVFKKLSKVAKSRCFSDGVNKLMLVVGGSTPNINNNLDKDPRIGVVGNGSIPTVLVTPDTPSTIRRLSNDVIIDTSRASVYDNLYETSRLKTPDERLLPV